MDRKERVKFGADQRPETEEKKEAPVVQESPKVLEDRMLEQAATEVANFQKEGAQRLETAETRATSEKLAIDDANKDELSALNQEVEHAQRELLNDLEEDPQTQPEKEEESPQMPPPIPQFLTKEREIISPEQLPAKEVSKKMLAEERKQLAEQIIRERRNNRDRMSELKNRLDILRKNLSSLEADWEEGQRNYEELCSLRSQQADSFAGRVKKMLNKIGVEFESDKQVDQSIKETAEKNQSLAQKKSALKEESESLTNLLESDSTLTEIKNQLADHYGKAEQASQIHFEQQQKTVEQTMLRNNVFFVHTIAENVQYRHNENSNVSTETTFDDDLDIILSLEPSLSVSSVNPGKDINGNVSGLWSLRGGVLLGGGQISESHFGDAGSISRAVKKRMSVGAEKKDFTVDLIDDVAKYRGHQSFSSMPLGGYNEFVVDNPEVFGYFQSAIIDDDGNYWINSVAKKQLEELHEEYRPSKKDQSSYYKELFERFQKNIRLYRDRINLIQDKGLPHYAMTEDRRFFECISVNDNGTIQIGSELTPSEVAKGKAGLPSENRKIIGEKLLNKSIFKKEETEKEAEAIIGTL